MVGHINVTGHIVGTHIREYVRHHPLWWALNVLLVIGGAAVGTWLLDGWLSFAVSLLLAALGFYVGARAAVLVIEREKLGTLR
jgi:hypothetical protein